MSLAQQQGASSLAAAAATVRLLPSAPLIAPVRQYVFPRHVPGEEEALQRGSLFVEVAGQAGLFLAQFAIGFLGSGVAQGLWTSPCEGTVLVAAGGYTYLLDLISPERTVLLPLRPTVAVVPEQAKGRVVLAGFHHLQVLEADRTWWSSGRVSWEGFSLSTLEGDLLHGAGWDMMTDEEVPFSLNLHSRQLTGGGYRQG